MLFMIIVKASHNSEGPNYRRLELEHQMDLYNQELVKSGVRVMAKGLHPSSEGIRFYHTISGEPPQITYGPFTPVSDQIAGFFLIDVESKEEAIKWAQQVPDPMGNGEGIIELRQLNE